MTCGSCGAATPEGSRSCAMCGAALAVWPPSASAARTSPCCSSTSFGSTSLAERLDPEALRLFIDRYFAGCTDAVTAGRRDGGEVHRRCRPGRVRGGCQP